MADVLHVRGLKEFQKGLNDLEDKMGPELRKGLNEVADIVAQVVRRKTPRLTGAAVASVKTGSSQRAAAVKVGGSKAPYFPWLEWGGNAGPGKKIHRPFVREGRTIYPTAAEKREELIDKLNEILTRLAEAAGFTDEGGRP